jgi:hypothetical protein
MLPKTSKTIGIGVLGLVGVAILLAVVNGIQQSSNQPQRGSRLPQRRQLSRLQSLL